MSFFLSQLTSLTKLLATNPNEVKALVKLVSVDVLKSLGEAKYTVLVDNKTLTAQSEKPLAEGVKYWSQLTQPKNSHAQLLHPQKMPQQLENIQNSNIRYSLKELQTLIISPKPETILKQNLLENLSNAQTKEQFSNASNLLLSLQNNIFTIPMYHENRFAILQFKKRYNKKSKTTQLDFYAALEFLGPISGVVTLEDGCIDVSLHVAFSTTKIFLENDMENFSYNVNISLIEDIQPLYITTNNSILDISI